ncbi:hypothetical protein M3193_10300 [Sporosarcina luteola]|nr:hypothetical protein [Sporosarcina luteola]MCM3744537.1 hypothetical protein [Sporosarcina luteola]
MGAGGIALGGELHTLSARRLALGAELHSLGARGIALGADCILWARGGLL